MGDFQLAMSWCGKNVINLNNGPKNRPRKRSEFGRPSSDLAGTSLDATQSDCKNQESGATWADKMQS